MDCVKFSAQRLKYLPVYKGYFIFISTNSALEDRVEYRVFKKEIEKREGDHHDIYHKSNSTP